MVRVGQRVVTGAGQKEVVERLEQSPQFSRGSSGQRMHRDLEYFAIVLEVEGIAQRAAAVTHQRGMCGAAVLRPVA